eukprot:COSAG04_NODE_22520_length_353_cov_1.208661_1_plen_53_part_10
MSHANAPPAGGRPAAAQPARATVRRVDGISAEDALPLRGARTRAPPLSTSAAI